MKFFKENSYDVVRLFINQIGIAIFSMIIYTAIGMVNIDSDARLGIKVAVSVFAILFYFALLYTVAWDWGAKDKIRIDGGRLEPDVVKFKGAKIAFLANIPNFVLSFISSLTVGLYILGVEGALGVSAIFNIFTRLLMSMYLGLLQGVFVFLNQQVYVYQFWQAVGYFFIPVFAIAVTQIGYSFGLKERKIFPTAVNKNKKS